MKSKILTTFDEAVADIPDGATIMFPGFGGVGAPQNLIAAIHSKGVKDITGITNDHGGLDGRMDVGTLVEAGQIRKLVCAFTAMPHPSMITPFARLYEEGSIEGELVPQGTLAERIRAAGAGIGAFYTPTSVGTEVAEGKEHRVIDGCTYVLEYPLPADFALIRACRADTAGNLQYRRSQTEFQSHHGSSGCRHHRRGGEPHRGTRRNSAGRGAYAGHLRQQDRLDNPGGHLGLKAPD